MKGIEFNKSWPWVANTSVRNASMQAPRRPGIYAIGTVERLAGLPVGIRWVYVGRAVGKAGLRGRLRQHEPVLERNPALRLWLADRHPGTEVWFAATGTADTAIALEKALIQRLNPRFNSIGRSDRIVEPSTEKGGVSCDERAGRELPQAS
jgi:hypothetical protein